MNESAHHFYCVQSDTTNCTTFKMPFTSCENGICTAIFDVSSSPCHPTSEILVIVTTNESENMSTVTQRVSGWLKEAKP